MAGESYYWSPERRRRLRIARREARSGTVAPQAERTKEERKPDAVETDGTGSEAPKTILNPEVSADFKQEQLPWHRRLRQWGWGKTKEAGAWVQRKTVESGRWAGEKIVQGAGWAGRQAERGGQELGGAMWRGARAIKRAGAKAGLFVMETVEEMVTIGSAATLVGAVGALLSDIVVGTSFWAETIVPTLTSIATHAAEAVGSAFFQLSAAINPLMAAFVMSGTTWAAIYYGYGKGLFMAPWKGAKAFFESQSEGGDAKHNN